MKAVTRIEHKDSDGKETVFEPGETVTKSKFSDEEWDQLVAGGSVAESVPDVAPAAGGYQKTSDILETELGESEQPQTSGGKTGEKETGA